MPTMEPIARMSRIALNLISDSFIGGGTGDDLARGQLGQVLELNNTEAALLSDTSIGTLYAGQYQYVKMKGTLTITPARGLIVYWDAADVGGATVTPDDQGGTADIAGVLISALPAGKYGWIQISGVASVKFGTLTRTAGIGDTAIVVASTAVADNIDSNDAINGDNVNALIGVCVELPVSGTITRVRLGFPHRYNP